MAHFIGYVKGRTRCKPASRLGTKDSGISVRAASWQGSVVTTLYELDGVDMAQVWLEPWQGKGTLLCLYDGPVNGGPFNGGQDAPQEG